MKKITAPIKKKKLTGAAPTKCLEKVDGVKIFIYNVGVKG